MQENTQKQLLQEWVDAMIAQGLFDLLSLDRHILMQVVLAEIGKYDK